MEWHNKSSQSIAIHQSPPIKYFLKKCCSLPNLSFNSAVINSKVTARYGGRRCYRDGGTGETGVTYPGPFPNRS